MYGLDISTHNGIINIDDSQTTSDLTEVVWLGDLADFAFGFGDDLDDMDATLMTMGPARAASYFERQAQMGIAAV